MVPCFAGIGINNHHFFGFLVSHPFYSNRHAGDGTLEHWRNVTEPVEAGHLPQYSLRSMSENNYGRQDVRIAALQNLLQPYVHGSLHGLTEHSNIPRSYTA